jgi:2-octaprenyl-6-methoxyphenol hydroxylase
VAQIDVLIRGAGPVGCTLALALRREGIGVALLGDRTSRSGFRPIALSDSSRLILERLGIWSSIDSTPIEAIRVTQAGGFGRATLDADDAGVAALGHVTEYASLLDALHRQTAELIVSDPSPARCVVHAEGWSGDAREKRYAQDALVARVQTRPGSRTMAFERFTEHGPLALLPLSGSYAVIWSMAPTLAAALAASPDAEFLASLAKASGNSCGAPIAVDSRSVVPLTMRIRHTRIDDRSVHIGNAAQTLHPVAGQGLNLGLRDAWELGCAMRESTDPGDAAMLQRYAASRRLDAGATVRVTDLLAGMFLGSSRLPRAARGVALSALDLLPGPRRFFTRRMIFGASAFP